MKTETLKNITAALFLGALGSGIWSLAGEPAFKWCVDVFISIAHAINKEYYDLLHVNVGKGFHEESGSFFILFFNIIFALSILFLPFFSHMTHKRSRRIGSKKVEKEIDFEKEVSALQKKTGMLLTFSVIYSLIAFPIVVSRIIVQEYNSEAVVFVERSIEILSPYLTNEEIIRLRADYRSIFNAESFYHVFDKMQKVASEHDIDLPDFDVAR